MFHSEPARARRPRGRLGLVLGLAFAACAGVAPARAAAIASGASLYATCSTCHGPAGQGNAALGAPPIGGLDAAYVERQLRNFASGLRGAQKNDVPGATMRAASAQLTTDAERGVVAGYVAGLPRARAQASPVSENGRNYYNAVCSACHGANGLGNTALGAPRLAGMPIAYLSRQFRSFRDGQRGAVAGDKLGAQMRAITAMIPDARTEADVLAYAINLKP